LNKYLDQQDQLQDEFDDIIEESQSVTPGYSLSDLLKEDLSDFLYNKFTSKKSISTLNSYMQLDFDFKINGQNIILKNFGSFEKYGLRAALKYYCNELLKSDVLKNISLSDIVETPNSVKSILVSKLNEI